MVVLMLLICCLIFIFLASFYGLLILMFWVQVIRPNEFELHAGSANKRPADYIYLENGQTLRDLLNACKHVDLDSLSETILSSIGSSVEKPLSCLICKGNLLCFTFFYHLFFLKKTIL